MFKHAHLTQILPRTLVLGGVAAFAVLAVAGSGSEPTASRQYRTSDLIDGVFFQTGPVATLLGATPAAQVFTEEQPAAVSATFAVQAETVETFAGVGGRAQSPLDAVGDPGSKKPPLELEQLVYNIRHKLRGS